MNKETELEICVTVLPFHNARIAEIGMLKIEGSDEFDRVALGALDAYKFSTEYRTAIVDNLTHAGFDKVQTPEVCGIIRWRKGKKLFRIELIVKAQVGKELRKGAAFEWVNMTAGAYLGAPFTNHLHPMIVQGMRFFFSMHDPDDGHNGRPSLGAINALTEEDLETSLSFVASVQAKEKTLFS